VVALCAPPQVCDTVWALEELDYESPALQRLSQYHPCSFGAGRPRDVLAAIVYKAPVMRVRITQLRWVGVGTRASASPGGA
jgi:hypothetical protein